ncbi:DUF1127 domain-containing protein [Hoeflea marina]|uniref:DUF1127 domain-containing protein n=1 Tax=Hoeflea marina TaxID=274592 RepID=UPI000D718ADA|nr:DUF1127 domain-containing protein [Hoeflea marina]
MAQDRDLEAGREARRVKQRPIRKVCRLVLVTWPGRRRQRRHLSDLDAEGLRDIGKTKCQALREARRWFWD